MTLRLTRPVGFVKTQVLLDGHGRTEPQFSKPCRSPKVWQHDPRICGGCGRDLTSHKGDGTIPGYADAVWAWMLKHGGRPNYFGGYHDINSALVRDHMRDCAVDHQLSDLPELGHVRERADTLSEADEIDAIVGRLTCRCSEVRFEAWAYVGDISMGELMFQVLNG